MRYERENEERREMREVGRERKHEKKGKEENDGAGGVGFYLRGLQLSPTTKIFILEN